MILFHFYVHMYALLSCISRVFCLVGFFFRWWNTSFPWICWRRIYFFILLVTLDEEKPICWYHSNWSNQKFTFSTYLFTSLRLMKIYGKNCYDENVIFWKYPLSAFFMRMLMKLFLLKIGHSKYEIARVLMLSKLSGFFFRNLLGSMNKNMKF